jgi:hypothetical protein
MGKSTLTFQDLIEAEEKNWKGFRNGLSQESKKQLDRLFESAYLYHHAGSQMSGVVPPFNAILVSMMIDLGYRLQRLEARSKPSGGSGPPPHSGTN